MVSVTVPIWFSLMRMELAMPFFDALSKDAGVGHKEVVAHELHPVTQGGGQHAPAVTVVLGHAVLDRDDGILVHELGQPLAPFLRSVELSVLTGDDVLAVLVEFGRGGVDGQHDLGARIVAGFLDGPDDVAESLLMALEVGGVAAFVTDGRGEPVLLQDGARGYGKSRHPCAGRHGRSRHAGA